MPSPSSWQVIVALGYRSSVCVIRSRSLVEGLLQGPARLRTGTMQQDPLVGLGEAQDVTDLPGRHPVYVSHGDHFPLARRELLDRRAGLGQDLLGFDQRFPRPVPSVWALKPASRPPLAGPSEARGGDGPLTPVGP